MATRPTILKTDCIASDWPTISSWYCSTVSAGLTGAAKRRSAAAFRAVSTTTFMVKGRDSLRRKSKAPSFIDSITAWVVPKALMMITMAFGDSARILASRSSPPAGLRCISAITRSGFSRQNILKAFAEFVSVITRTPEAFSCWRAQSRKSVSLSTTSTV